MSSFSKICNSSWLILYGIVQPNNAKWDEARVAFPRNLCVSWWSNPTTNNLLKVLNSCEREKLKITGYWKWEMKFDLMIIRIFLHPLSLACMVVKAFKKLLPKICRNNYIQSHVYQVQSLSTSKKYFTRSTVFSGV